MSRKNTQSLPNVKSQLRKRFTELRKKLTAAEVWEKSEIIGQKLLATTQISDAKSFSSYLAIGNEVDTKLIIDSLVSKGMKVYLPTYNARSKSYFFSRFNHWENLELGPYGILQPVDTSSDTPGVGSAATLLTPGVRLDLAIVPGVAFDKKGVRLGYGKGFFDLLLANSSAFKIGLAYDFQIVKKLPQEEHDLVMDLVVTEKRVIRS